PGGRSPFPGRRPPAARRIGTGCTAEPLSRFQPIFNLGADAWAVDNGFLRKRDEKQRKANPTGYTPSHTVRFMNETEQLEFDTPLEEEVGIDVPPDQRKVYTQPGDPEIESLHGRFKRGRLDIQPDFQRQFVWDRAKASRLIESALLDIPL